MLRNRSAPAACGLLLAALCQPGFAAASGVQLAARIFQERPALASGHLERVPAAFITPGSDVIYEVSYTYAGPGEADVIITNPWPNGLLYRSYASRQEDATLQVSVDGGNSFNTLDRLRVPMVNGGLRAAEAADITHVQWTLSRPLKPGEAGNVSLKATVR